MNSKTKEDAPYGASVDYTLGPISTWMAWYLIFKSTWNTTGCSEIKK